MDEATYTQELGREEKEREAGRKDNPQTVTSTITSVTSSIHHTHHTQSTIAGVHWSCHMTDVIPHTCVQLNVYTGRHVYSSPFV